MKKPALFRAAGFAAVFAASVLWLLFVIDIWENGTAMPLPREVSYLSDMGNAAYTVSAGLPAAALCLIWGIPRLLGCVCPRWQDWKGRYTAAAGVLLVAQTVCMLPASRRFAAFAGSWLDRAAMRKMLAFYVHTILPWMVLCAVCGLVCAGAELKRTPDRIPDAVRKNGRHLLCGIAISALVPVASMLLLNILDTYGIVNKAFIHGFCYQNAGSAAAARISLLWAPVVEEIAFRALICRGLDKFGRKWPAILISAVLFGVWHRNMAQFAYTLLWGIIFGYVLLTTGSVFWPMLMHGASNLLTILAYSGSAATVFGPCPRLWTFRVWLGNLPAGISALGLAAVSAAVVILLRCCRTGRDA